MPSHGITELQLNYARAFVRDEMSFVANVPELEGLSIVPRTIDDVSPIHELHAVSSLKVDT